MHVTGRGRKPSDLRMSQGLIFLEDSGAREIHNTFKVYDLAPVELERQRETWAGELLKGRMPNRFRLLMPLTG